LMHDSCELIERKSRFPKERVNAQTHEESSNNLFGRLKMKHQ
jgi:hypothetical protein